jgi:hypothetical protein
VRPVPRPITVADVEWLGANQVGAKCGRRTPALWLAICGMKARSEPLSRCERPRRTVRHRSSEHPRYELLICAPGCRQRFRRGRVLVGRCAASADGRSQTRGRPAGISTFRYMDSPGAHRQEITAADIGAADPPFAAYRHQFAHARRHPRRDRAKG